MLITMTFSSLRLDRLILHPTMDSNVSLIGYHVVGLKAELENGIFLMGQLFQLKVGLQHFTETEEMMEQLT